MAKTMMATNYNSINNGVMTTRAWTFWFWEKCCCCGGGGGGGGGDWHASQFFSVFLLFKVMGWSVLFCWWTESLFVDIDMHSTSTSCLIIPLMQGKYFINSKKKRMLKTHHCEPTSNQLMDQKSGSKSVPAFSWWSKWPYLGGSDEMGAYWRWCGQWLQLMMMIFGITIIIIIKGRKVFCDVTFTLPALTVTTCYEPIHWFLAHNYNALSSISSAFLAAIANKYAIHKSSHKQQHFFLSTTRNFIFGSVWQTNMVLSQ